MKLPKILILFKNKTKLKTLLERDKLDHRYKFKNHKKIRMANLILTIMTQAITFRKMKKGKISLGLTILRLTMKAMSHPETQLYTGAHLIISFLK